MFNKKPRRNFRQRKGESSDEEDGQQKSEDREDNGKTPAVINKPSKVLHGRGISCSSKREAAAPKPDSSVETAGSTKCSDGGKNSTILSFSDDKEAEELEFKLKKSSQKAVLFQVKKKAVPPDNDPHNDGALTSDCRKQDYGSQASPDSVHPDDDDDDDDSRSLSASSTSSFSTTEQVPIANAKAIAAAKSQRCAARTQKEFIPLGKDGYSSSGSTPDHRSRDDEEVSADDDYEPDDHERRIEFAPKLKSIREKIAEHLGSDNSMSGTDGEEQELWEEIQIEKGIKRRSGEQSPSGSESSSSSRRGQQRQKKWPPGVFIPDNVPLVTVSMVKRRITGKLDSMKEVHRSHQAELRRMEGDAENARSSVEILEEKSSEKQLRFYRAMILYVHHLVDCLQEKVVQINSLELELHTLLSDQMESLLAQRQQKIKEQADYLQHLSYNMEENGSSANGTQTNDEKCEVKVQGDIDDMPEDTQPSAEEEEQLHKKMADILLKSQVVFSDVQDEFSIIKNILSHFEEWRASYSDTYHSAYISLCLPKLLNPIIRLQLLAWNPLKDAGGDFEDLPWFSEVETFCHGHGYEELERTDRQILSNVIEKTVLPKITAFVDLVWDPMSLRQTVCLSEVCHRLKEDYSIFEGEQSKPVKDLIEAVSARLKNCVDEDIFIPLYPKKFLEDEASPQCRFRNQQFWMAVKLLGNMGKWDLLLPESVLKELMLDKLLNRYLVFTLSSHTLTSAMHGYNKIANSLPRSWFRGADSCLPQLQSFRNYLVEKVHSICKQQPHEDPNTRSAVVEVLQVLSRIRCFNAISALAEKYHYEDLIYAHQLLNQEGL
ncbi:GC-rich sequence DNA-binding factor 2 [Thalassophryne amazonica]|uniref:GC-rich sequence DNA-binding factor 2 n=1 Tax=Thalassophryne amazonica TaxID=390379 RepID=UPI00147143A8|nr:GC-rich sequence DNA-binding factor 2 [Thalassophryne amazonica]